MAIPLPAVLIVLDGWGHSERTEGNAIAASRPRFMEWLGRTYPTTLLQAAGEAGGLPAGVIGNSQGGHPCLRAGRVVLPEPSRINPAVPAGEVATNAAPAPALPLPARPPAA